MKKILFFALLVCINYIAYSQTDSLIYGIARISNPASVFLAKINASTGVVSNISSISVATSEQIPNATIDAYNQIYYFVDGNNNIVGLSLATGAVVSSNPITNSNGDYFQQMIFNCANNTIYGLARVGAPAAIYLAKINPLTGVVTNISSSSVATSEQIPNATIDVYNKIYYFVDGNGNIVGLNLTTGAVVSSNPITNNSADYFQQMIFNYIDYTIYGLARVGTPATVFFAKINPLTGVVTNISTASVALYTQIPNETIDPYNNIYYFVDQNSNFVALSLTTGNVIFTNSLTNSGADYFNQMLFNPHQCTNYILSGIENEKIIQTNINPNPAQNNFTIETTASEKQTLQVFDVNSKLVLTQIINGKTTIDASSLSNGIYTISLISNQGVVNKRLVVVK